MPAAASPLALMSHLSDGAAVRVLRARATFFGVGAVGVIRLELPGELRYRHVVLRAVGVACKAATADASDECDSVAAVTSFVSQVVTAVGEAFNNVVLHGYAGDRSGTVCVAVEIGIGFVRLIIEDMGESWDPLQVGTPNLEALPESGMGVFIMRSFMDEVAYRPGRPNVLTMTKRMG
jgi:serine/threonine-protein kinase RsbW